MASIETRINKGKKTYRIRLSEGEDPDRPRVGFGKITRKQAETAKVNVEALISAKNSGGEISVAVQLWLKGLSNPIRNKLVSLGLTGPVERRTTVSLGEWVDGYIEGRTDIKDNTERNMNAAKRSLFEFYSRSMNIADFTAFDAEELRRKLLDKDLAENTIRRRCKRIKQFFTAARKKRLITENPFDGVPISMLSNSQRQRFIGREEIQRVIDACPNIQWKLIFALTRYGGLRIPSELYGLTWDDILWDRKRFLIRSPKTEHIPGKETRMCPLFPELETYLIEAFDQAAPGQKNVITMPLTATTNLRTQAHRIIKKAGLVPWEKTFQNLRSSCETELVEKFPVHVVTEWLGNSPDIARKHYLQTHEEHFRRAVEDDGKNGGLSGGLNTAESDGTDLQGEDDAVSATSCCAIGYNDKPAEAIPDKKDLLPPRGLEPLLPG